MNYSKWLVAILNTSKALEAYGNENVHSKVAGIEGKFADEIFVKMNIKYDTVFPEDMDAKYMVEIGPVSWECVLLSFLATPSKAPIIKNFRELSKAVDRGTHRVYSLNGILTVLSFYIPKNCTFDCLIEQKNWYIPREEMVNDPLKNTHSAIVCQYDYLKLLFGAQ
ncbi:hypothetical protein TNIN_394711 [Trichonephila inaurata madagascariensis]|uniref:Uncharacterized protein n=1 Tax=Trichonephila inaurata madagascariensis TaxID=2747483 RepID=A0A8X7CL84_9ARAC|nr:hypothetical protein TNIN_394711 [Trichonephila inaurata madagascariensis]